MTSKELGIRSLRGLWVGDCIGNMSQLYNVFDVLKALEKGMEKYGGLLPLKQFTFSDDTEEAIVLYNHIVKQGDTFDPNKPIDLDSLAMEFATRYMERDPDGESFGYGLMTRKVLHDIYEGKPWAEANKTYMKSEGMSSHVDDLITSILDKKSWAETAKNVQDKIALEKINYKPEEKIGSCGNGAAMRVAPLGALLAEYTPYQVARASSLSALPTHDHPEGIAGAMAVAGMTKVLAKNEYGKEGILCRVFDVTPDSEVRKGILKAMNLSFTTGTFKDAIEKLGNGSHVTCQDTVPLCCWFVARGIWHKDDYEQVITDVTSVGGDVDTNCAIVGGMYGVISDPPEKWVKMCKPMEGVLE